MKRSCALLLLAALLLSTVACSNGTTDETTADPTSPAAETVPETEEDLDARLAIDDELPDKKFDGADFRIITRDRSDFINDVGFELELTGDMVNDAIFHRNKAIEERFDVKISAIYATNDGTSIGAAVQASVQANDDAYDVSENQVTSMASLATTGNYLDWYTQLPYVHLDKPWYIGNAAEALSVHGHAYAMIGEFNLDVLRFTYCMYYNKDISAAYNLEDIYSVVKDGRWTYDYLKTLADTVYLDLNADGVKGFNDQLALSGDPYSAVVTYQYAFDNPTVSLVDGYPALTINREKAYDIVAKLNALYWESEGALTEGWGSGSSTFMEGNLLCYTGLFQNATGYGDLEFDFAIIPYPKYDEAQSSYFTMADGAHGVQAVPITVSDPERTSIIIEALNAETYKNIVPAYFNIALKNRYSRDNESGEMLDLLMDARVFDFGYMYNTGIAFVIQDMVSQNSTNTESAYAGKIKATEKQYEKILESYAELEATLGER